MLKSFSKYMYVKLVLFMFISSLVSATNYYVKNGGNDSASGSDDANAWRTVNKVNGYSFASGDVIYFKRGSIFKGYTLIPPRSNLTFSAYGDGDLPTIDGEGVRQAMNTNSRDYLTFKNIKFFNPQNKIYSAGFQIQNCDNTVIDGCIIDGNNKPYYNATLSSDCNVATISNSQFINVGERHALYCEADNAIIEHNVFSDAPLGGLKFNDGDDSRPSYVENPIVRYNLFINNAYSLDDASSNNLNFSHNVIITSRRGIWLAEGPLGIWAKNGKISNNTIIIKGQSTSQNIGIEIDDRYSQRGGEGFFIENNIIYVEEQNDVGWFVNQEEGTTLPVFNNNIYFMKGISGTSSGEWRIGSSKITSLASWKSATGQDANSKYGDPLFVDYLNDNFSLKEGSPAIELNAGAFEYQQNGLIPVSAFSVNDRTPYTTQTVVFTEASINSPTSWQWTFSPTSVSYMDGTSLTSRNPRVKFNTAAVYTVTLRAANSAGSDNEVKNNYITASIPVIAPVSAFSANDRTPLTTQTVVFTEASTNSPTSWQWTFSPSSVSYTDGTSSTSRNPRVKFNTVGVYTVTLRAANSAGSDNEVKSDYITSSLQVLTPVSAFSANDRTPLTTQTVVFTDASSNSPTSWQWTFSPSSVSYTDGTSSTSRNPRVKFNTATVYTVTLRAANSAGSDNEVKIDYITSMAPIAPPTALPVAAFSANNLTPAYTQTVTFTDASTNSPTSWQWTFNPTNVRYMDGTSATSKNPHVRFNSSTTYSCTLSASNSGGSDSEVKTNFISVTGVKFEVSLFLAGTYENGSMKTTLNSKGFIPMTQPFNSPPWNYTGGETFTEEISEEVVDWILVELRTGLDESTRVARMSGIVKNDGLASRTKIIGFYFPYIPAGNYYIVVHHRNHLSVMSAEKVSINMEQPYVHYDFTNSQSKAYGADAMQDLGDGNYGLYSGDGNSDGAITVTDIQEFWIPEFLNSVDGYLQSDFDMDGSVTASDNNMFWLPNNKRISKVPN